MNSKNDVNRFVGKEKKGFWPIVNCPSGSSKEAALRRLEEAQTIRRLRKTNDQNETNETASHQLRGAEMRKRWQKIRYLTETEEEAALRRAKDAERKRKFRKLQKDLKKQSNKPQTVAVCESVDTTDCKLNIFKDMDPNEMAMYKNLYPKLENIVNRQVHCTSCNLHIGTAPINEALIKLHPVLRVIQCMKCYTFCMSDEFMCGDDGNEYYCRWCGQGGEVYCCSKCPKVYCRQCIERNISKEKVDEIINNEDWLCFACDSACMIQLRADSWALMNFIEKQKKEIANKSLSETELTEAMNKDCSKCCLSKLYSSEENILLDKRTNNKITPPKPKGSNKIVNNKSEITIPPLKVVQPTSNMLLDILSTSTAKKIVFHTANGFRVDLNEPGENKSYLLENGKLIHTNASKVSTSAPARAIPSAPGTPMVTKPSNNITTRKLIPKPVSLSTIPLKQMVPIKPETIENGNNIPSTTVQPTRKRKKTVKPKPGPRSSSPIDQAKLKFQVRFKSSMETCQHIMGKMKKLTKTTSFKSMKSVEEVKDLLQHLTYLCNYASNRFKTLHEIFKDDIKMMGFDPFNDDDDIKILEPNTPFIDLDSDENCADDMEWKSKKLKNCDIETLHLPKNNETNNETVNNSEATIPHEKCEPKVITTEEMADSNEAEKKFNNFDSSTGLTQSEKCDTDENSGGSSKQIVENDISLALINDEVMSKTANNHEELLKFSVVRSELCLPSIGRGAETNTNKILEEQIEFVEGVKFLQDSKLEPDKELLQENTVIKSVSNGYLSNPITEITKSITTVESKGENINELNEYTNNLKLVQETNETMKNCVKYADSDFTDVDGIKRST